MYFFCDLLVAIRHLFLGVFVCNLSVIIRQLFVGVFVCDLFVAIFIRYFFSGVVSVTFS
jgi:hypothetical protein